MNLDPASNILVPKSHFTELSAYK